MRELGNKPKITFSLLGMAAIDALEGRPARAARLWVAAETLREEIGLALVLWDHTVTDYEAILADARGRLGETAWQEAQNDGRDMTLEQVIEYAPRRRVRAITRRPGISPRAVRHLPCGPQRKGGRCPQTRSPRPH